MDHLFPEDLACIKEIIEEKAGFYLEALPEKSLEKSIRKRARVLSLDSQSYLQLLFDNLEEQQILIEELIVSETWFFRDRGAFEYLIHYVMRGEWRRLSNKKLKILSMGCSTGEEPYSIVMTLLDAGLPPEKFSVDAIDLSKDLLEKAQEGCYGRNSFRDGNLGFRHRYFSQTKKGFQIKKSIRKKVSFHHGSIVSSFFSLGRLASYQLIFCRNVMIYLHAEARDQVISLIERLLIPQGSVVVGAGEGMMLYRKGFVSVNYPKASAYRREVRERPEKVLVKPIQVSRSVSKKEEVINWDLVDTNQLMMHVSHLADLGKLIQAKQICESYLEKHIDNAQAYFILGLIQHAMKKEAQAKSLFNKTLYLDPNHYEALVYLALFADGAGDFDKGNLYRRRAEKVLMQSTSKSKL